MESNPEKSEISSGQSQGNSEKCGPSKPARTIRIISTIALLAGAVVSTVLIVHQSFSAVIGALSKVGWGLAIIFITQFLSYIFNGMAWRVLYHSDRKTEGRLMVLVRWIRESINYLLPVARMGGEIIAVRLLVNRGRDMNTVSAGLVADKTMEFLGLFCFAAIGIALLTAELLVEGGNWNVEHWSLIGLAVILVVVALFVLAQRLGLLKLIDKVVVKLSGRCGAAPENGISIHDMVWSIYADRSRVAYSLLMHIFAWFLGAVQIWVALRDMDIKITVSGAFMIESLVQVVCAAAFVMPASLGAQEAAYMTIGWWLFGIPPAVGLAVSLVQRMKDVVSGVAGLVVWQGFEGRHLWRLWKGRNHKDSRPTPKRSQ